MTSHATSRPSDRPRRTLRALGTAAMVSALVLWVACAGLHLREVVHGRLAWVSVYVTAPASSDAYPTVREFWPGATPEACGGLAIGDRVLEIGDADLRGVGPVGFVAHAHDAATAGGDLRVPLTYERDGAVGRTAIALVPVAYAWRMLPLTATLVITAALVAVRRRGARIASRFYWPAVAYGLHWTFFFGGAPWQTWTWAAVFSVASLVMMPLILRAVLVFPAETMPAGGRLPWWPWLFALFGPISLSWPFGLPFSPSVGFRGAFVMNVAFIMTVLAILTRNFRRAGPLGRRQLKWILLGMYLGTVPVLVADLVAVAVPTLWWLHDLAAIAEICIPLSMLTAVVYANAFDVDRLITATAGYSVLLILLLSAVLFAVPALAGAISRAVRIDPRLVQLGLSVGAATGIVPGYRALRPRIEQALFEERHALRSGVDTLLRDLATTSGPETLFTLVGARLDALVRPASCLIYVPLGDTLTAVVARGGDAHAASLTDATLIQVLRTCPAPLDVQQRAAMRALHPDERAAVSRVPAVALVPVRRDGELLAAICLGAKRSGDVYTATDLALLGAIADKVAGELLRFDAAVILQQERDMSETLRRYVPEPVVARLARGQSIDGGEQDVSVLFVDIRGYTTYSEQRTAGAVFSLINRYTEVVSSVIQRRGGTVVQFLGDGLMAVFGAPEPLPEHARAAVQAACEVVAAVRNLAGDESSDHPSMAVGVGIATGQAFVGNVRTNDRFVYTAIGDVVNLASRIEHLTRELEATIAIDACTHRTAGEAVARFRRHERMTIRGRVEPVDVYSLPAAAA